MNRAQSRQSIPAVEAASPESDGRRRRSQDSRARIVQAMLELVEAGEVSPAAEQVAARAKVSLRSVFRHFNDLDSLYAEMASVVENGLQSVLDEPLKSAAWQERVLELIQRRAAVYEKIWPFKRASDVHRRGSAFLEASHARMVAMAREILRRQLPEDVAADRNRFEALDLLLSFETWTRLRRDQQLTPRRAMEVLDHSVRRLIA